MRIAIATLIVCCGMPLAAADTIQGRWRLLSAEDIRADGSVARYPWGQKPVGAIIVEGGYCYVQIMSSDVPSFTFWRMPPRMRSSFLLSDCSESAPSVSASGIPAFNNVPI